MKTIILALVLVCAVSTQSSAQVKVETTPAAKDVKFWYYPTQNIYFNETTGEYWYYDEPTVKWVEVKTLPSTITVLDADTKYEVYYKDEEVWRMNQAHKSKYKVKTNGNKEKTKEVVKPKE
jgi:hypothetical protein